MDNFLHSLRILYNVLLCFLLFFYGKFWRASTPFMIIESRKMTRFPRIEPMIDRETIHIKNVQKISGRPALKTEKNTMHTLSDSMMLTLFIASAE